MPTVDIKCIKSPFYRSVYVSGVSAYLMKAKEVVVIAFYSERAELPDKFTHELNEDGTIGAGKIEQTKMLREFEGQILLNPETLKRVIEQLKGVLGE